jgi:sialate O-acetylesterase
MKAKSQLALCQSSFGGPSSLGGIVAAFRERTRRTRLPRRPCGQGASLQSTHQINFDSALVAALSILLLSVSSVRGDVKLASPFTDHMVLQQGMKVPVWGTADPGEKVTVTFNGQTQTATAGTDGNWMVRLADLKAGGPFAMTIAGKNTITINDVLVGEVWLGSGQSNMDFTVSKKVKSFAGVTNEEAEIAAANYPLIRMFTGDPIRTNQPQSRVPGEWRVCSPETVPAFSAVGYFFARQLQKDIKIPIGIITLSYGASTAEAWIRREALEADPQLKPMVERFDEAVQAFRTNAPAVAAPARSEDVSNPSGTTNQTSSAGQRRGGGPGRGGPRDPIQDQHNPTVLFNGMINPVIPYAIRGVIWYQGESIVGGDAGRKLYPHVQATLIKDWRQRWGEGDFPFYIVQLAGQEANSNSPVVREAQATVLSLPNTGMAVTTDIGEARNVHPRNKQDVGDRLARIALANVYGRKIEYSGPVYESMKVEGNAIRVKFSHLGGGLVAKGGPLKWFVIAGADQKFVPAEAKIDGDSVVVSSPEVTEPQAVRYAWVNYPEGCNLYNAAGLPAAQFRSDKW